MAVESYDLTNGADGIAVPVSEGKLASLFPLC